MPELEVEERALNFEEVELGFTEEMAIAEAKRCLSCRRCIGCGLCLAECDQDAIEYDQQPEPLTLSVDAIILAPGAEVFNPSRLKELGYGRAPDIVTSIEFERLLSPTGPFGGRLLRPSDGEIPRTIAFVQCVGSRNEDISANYCSNICCSVTLNQLEQAQSQISDLRVSVFFSDFHPFSKQGEHYLQKAESSSAVNLTRGAVEEIAPI